MARQTVAPERRVELPPLWAACDGDTIHAGVRVGAQSRQGLERLCRYLLRPPLARSRLEPQRDGTILLRLHRTWSDGTAALSFTSLELIEKLAALIPRPRTNQIFYTGVFAPASKWRAEIVPRRPETQSGGCRSRGGGGLPCAAPLGRYRWADLLARAFEVSPFAWPQCNGRMELRAVVIGPPAPTRILAGLEAAVARSRAPPATAAAGEA